MTKCLVEEEQQWENLRYFLQWVVPVAEEADVKMTMHTDDPPLSPIRGVVRIMSSIDNYQRIVDLVCTPARRQRHPEKFAETFHDDGQTDLVECLRAYRDVGYEGVCRPDHYPKMGDDSFDNSPHIAQLFAVGYFKGLREAGSRNASKQDAFVSCVFHQTKMRGVKIANYGFFSWVVYPTRDWHCLVVTKHVGTGCLRFFTSP